MKKRVLRLLCLVALLIVSLRALAQNVKRKIATESVDVIAEEKYTLHFIDKTSALDSTVKQRMIDAFFTVYPKEAAIYNKHTARNITFIIDPAYDGVAATGNDTVRFNPEWFHKHPGDIDVVTHEVMHIVQDYGDTDAPGWITEGIADYVRYKFGVDNTGAGWKLPDYNEKQNYDNAYRISARFFLWIEQHYDKNFVKQLDDVMRKHTYTDGFAKQKMGKTFNELWAEYEKNPSFVL